MSPAQKTLSREQVSAFDHENFVADQVQDFLELVRIAPRTGAVVADVGGGCGYFARALQDRSAWRVRVLDMDSTSVEAARRLGVEARIADALEPAAGGDEQLVSFNLMLHHLVAGSAAATRAMQLRALRAWAGRAEAVFVNEYIYESWGEPRLSGALIHAVTGSRVLSWLARAVARFVPSLRANTFGVGVRFRAAAEWRSLFREAGYEVVAQRRGAEEAVSPARRALLIRSCRRDSFLLRPLTLKSS